MNDREELLGALLTIGGATSVADFGLRVCQELMRLVPSISASYNEINFAAQRMAVVVHPDPGPEVVDHYLPILERYVEQNPFCIHLRATGEGDVATWPDHDPADEFRHTTLFREFYAPLGIHSQANFTLPAPPGIDVALALNRDGTEIDDRERALLTRLRAHLTNLYRLVSHAEAARSEGAVLTDEGWSVVLVDGVGTVIESNPVAVTIGDAAGVDLTVGASLRGEPFFSSARADQRAGLWVTTQPPRIDPALVPFEARFLPSRVGPNLLWLRHANPVGLADAVALGLTHRQAQIAVLLVDGLTNVQIAQRLGVAIGTVRAHMESIFARLGVNTRAGVVGRLQTRRGMPPAQAAPGQTAPGQAAPGQAAAGQTAPRSTTAETNASI